MVLFDQQFDLLFCRNWIRRHDLHRILGQQRLRIQFKEPSGVVAVPNRQFDRRITDLGR